MAGGKNKNYVSIWFWLFALFVAALPCIGFIMTIVWAFAGENESRKNYFRAILIWMLVGMILSVCLFTFGFWPVIQKNLLIWIQQIK